MKTIALASRNLLRNARRSMATVLALAIGATSVLLFGGYSADIKFSLLSDYVQNGGHLQIQHKDFYLFGNGNPTAYGLAKYEYIIKGIRDDPVLKAKVRVVSPYLQFGGLAGNYAEGVSRPVMGVGYVADDVARMRTWNEYELPFDAAPYKLVGASADTVIVGVGVARVLLLCERLKVANCPRPQVQKRAAASAPSVPDDVAALALGEASSSAASAAATSAQPQIELLATQPRGTPNVASVKVLAAEDQGYKDLDEVVVKLQLSQAQRLVYGRGEPKVTGIMVQLEHTADIPLVKRRIADLLRGVEGGSSLAVLDFEQVNPFYGETVSLFSSIFGFIFLLIGGIVLFTVSNTMTAAVVERTNEIGTVRAVGLRRSGIQRLFVTEGFLLGCVGAIAGVLVALAAAWLINALELKWQPPGTSTPLPLNVRVSGELAMIFSTMAGLILVATVSAWVPALRASRMSIVDALRHA